MLIAEDDAVSRTILLATVRKLGYEPLVAGDGEEAWALLREREVDVVVSDWMMPGCSGVELCRRVREANRPGYTYFILLTALGEGAHLREGMEAGADEYLTKPLDREQLQVRLLSAERVTALHHRIAAQQAELERLNRRLYEEARTDPLTRLSNRLQLREGLELLHARVERYGHRYCVGLCDVDHFKAYNDAYGHLSGDDVLRTVADAMAGNCRKGDKAYRYGGEEFLVLLPEQTLDTATVALERLRRVVEALRIPHAPATPPGVVTLSAGVALLRPGEPEGAEAVLRRADEALYRAKALGRNRVVVDGAEDGAADAMPAAARRAG